MVFEQDGYWFWTIPAFSRAVGPFTTREQAVEDMVRVIGVTDGV